MARFLWETLTLMAAIILVFTLVYRWLEHWSWTESFYSSVMISTLVGKGQPRLDATKLLMAAQALLSFVVAGQLVLFFAQPPATRLPKT